MYFLSQNGIFRFHVSFRGCINIYIYKCLIIYRVLQVYISQPVQEISEPSTVGMLFTSMFSVFGTRKIEVDILISIGKQKEHSTVQEGYPKNIQGGPPTS